MAAEQRLESENKWPALLSRLLLIMLSAALLTLAVVLVIWLNKPGNFPFKKVELVNQLHNQESRELQQVAAQALNGGFFSLDVDVFRAELLTRLPWVKSVSVRKVWPDKLQIEIAEYKPVVRWQSVDSRQHSAEQFLSQQGIIFQPQLTAEQKLKFARLAIFYGPKMSAERVLEKCFAMNKEINKLAFGIESCGMNKRRTWSISLLGSAVEEHRHLAMDVRLGKEKIMQQLKRFVEVFSGKLKHYLSAVDYVDLRYTNGFSIRWNKVGGLENRNGKVYD